MEMKLFQLESGTDCASVPILFYGMFPVLVLLVIGSE